VDEEKNLQKEIKELNERIAELEDQISRLVKPVQEMQNNTRNYFKLLDIALRHGRVSPDLLIPEIKDPISKDIVCVLVDKGYQNVSQITEGVKSRRGSSSRRIVREKLKLLEGMDIVVRSDEKKIATYYISNDVLRKWSQILGISI